MSSEKKSDNVQSQTECQSQSDNQPHSDTGLQADVEKNVQPQPQQQPPIITSKVIVPRPLRRAWYPSNDKETYSTVVVNYHYPPRSVRCCFAKRRVNKEKNLAMTKTNEKTRDGKSSGTNSKMYLCTLYEESGESSDESSTYMKKCDMNKKEICPSSVKCDELILISSDEGDGDDEATTTTGDEHKAGGSASSTSIEANTKLCKGTQNPDSINKIQQTEPIDNVKTRDQSSSTKANAKLSTTAVKGSESQILKVKANPQPTFKQRQLELHRHRISVEEKRLELIELKIARERDAMFREQVLYEKEYEYKVHQIQQLK